MATTTAAVKTWAIWTSSDSHECLCPELPLVQVTRPAPGSATGTNSMPAATRRSDPFWFIRSKLDEPV